MDFNDETKCIIDHLLESLGLSYHKHTIVGDIFICGVLGGQKVFVCSVRSPYESTYLVFRRTDQLSRLAKCLATG